MQVIHKAERQELRNHIEHLIYFILSQRHLRQTVIMLQDCFRLQTVNEGTQNEDGHLEELAIEVKLVCFGAGIAYPVVFMLWAIALTGFTWSWESKS